MLTQNCILLCKKVITFFFYVELQILPFSNAFYRGLTDLISPSWLKLFNASEFNQVFSFYVHLFFLLLFFFPFG